VLRLAESLGRFVLVRHIGAGGFGVVYEADDPRYRCRVALKVLRKERIVALQGFKREFRALADLTHPNLVRLYELATEGDTWYVAMELVEGSTFLAYVWDGDVQTASATVSGETHRDDFRGEGGPRPRIDVARLRAATRDLAGAVNALHAARKLHCDLKPSNVLVTIEGRVVVLDFGLVAEMDDREAGSERPLGTPGYMSPEQARREAMGPATDWYSVGAMLYEALTGELPSVGARPRLSPDLEAELSDLADLCADLLTPEPSARPSGAEVLARLGGRTSRTSELLGSIEVGRCAFFGRREELAQLHAARREIGPGRTAMVRVVASSGMGKTALVRRFLDELEEQAPETLVLSGRSYEQESVPYKVFDSVMDALARHLSRLPKDELARIAPRHASRLTRLFRVFEHVDFGDARVAPEAVAGGSQAQRREAFIALRELLVAISVTRPIVLFFDDLQWGDVDSAHLLAELVRAPHAPQMLVVATQHPHTASRAFQAALDEALTGIEQRTIVLAELPAEDARSMASHLLGDTLGELADPVAREGSGHPIFIQQLAERAIVSGDRPDPSFSLGHVIMERVARLDGDARKLIEAVAIAGHPITEEVATRAAGLQGAGALKATSTVRNVRLVVTRQGSSSTLELAHDRVREAISAAASATSTRETHTRLAEALLAYGHVDPEDLVRHYEGAGDAARAREHGAAAAIRAENAYAFDRAAQYWAIVLEHTAHSEATRWQLLQRWAEALANAGRGGEAGDAYQAAADALAERQPDRLEIVTLSRCAGEHALRSGRLDLGTTRMSRVLERVGVSMPRSRTAASAQSVARRLRLFVRGTSPAKVTRSIDPKTSARLDALWAASTGLSMANHVVADALGLTHLLEALDAGDTSAVVRGLGYEAAFEAVIGGPFLRRRCQTIIREMDELAQRSNAPYDLAWARMSKGVTAWFLGDWSESWTHCTAASALYREHCRGVAWELAICDAYRLPALAYLGDLPQVAELVPLALRAARERGDLFAASNLRMGQQSMVLLASDRPIDAIRETSEGIAAFSTKTYLLPHYHHLFARVQAELYRGHTTEAWRCVEADWPGLTQARLLLAQFVRVEIRHLRARAALALAESGSSSTGPSPRELRRAALAEAAKIERDQVAPAKPFAAAIRAGAAAHEDREAAVRHLERARAGFRDAGMQLYAHATLDRLGALRGGTEGATMREEAQRWMTTNQIANPRAMIAMLVPGV